MNYRNLARKIVRGEISHSELAEYDYAHDPQFLEYYGQMAPYLQCDQTLAEMYVRSLGGELDQRSNLKRSPEQIWHYDCLGLLDTLPKALGERSPVAKQCIVLETKQGSTHHVPRGLMLRVTSHDRAVVRWVKYFRHALKQVPPPRHFSERTLPVWANRLMAKLNAPMQAVADAYHYYHVAERARITGNGDELLHLTKPTRDVEHPWMKQIVSFNYRVPPTQTLIALHFIRGDQWFEVHFELGLKGFRQRQWRLTAQRDQVVDGSLFTGKVRELVQLWGDEYVGFCPADLSDLQL